MPLSLISYETVCLWESELSDDVPIKCDETAQNYLIGRSTQSHKYELISTFKCKLYVDILSLVFTPGNKQLHKARSMNYNPPCKAQAI